MKLLLRRNVFKFGTFFATTVVLIAFYLTSQAFVSDKIKILLPLYIYPNWYESESYVWSKVMEAAEQVPIVAIINPNNGPDGKPPNQDYARGLKDLRESGVTILGYVYTKYGDRPIEEVKQDIALYHNYYGIDGIFLDESASSAKQLNYYQDIYNYVQTSTNFDQVIINPGTHTDEAYFNSPATDTSVIFEDYSAAWQKYQPASYRNQYKPNHFAILIHSVPDAATMKQHIDRAIDNNIGYIYITDDSPNAPDGDPWNTLPSYWQEEVNYIKKHN